MYGQIMCEDLAQIDYPASKLAQYDQTRVMKHENPAFYLLAQNSEPIKLGDFLN